MSMRTKASATPAILTNFVMAIPLEQSPNREPSKRNSRLMAPRAHRKSRAWPTIARGQNRVCNSIKISAVRGGFSYISERLPLSVIPLIPGVRFLPLDDGLILARPSVFRGGDLLSPIATETRAPLALLAEASESNVTEDLPALVADFGYIDTVLLQKLTASRFSEPHGWPCNREATYCVLLTKI
jgi:hypothetical protein